MSDSSNDTHREQDEPGLLQGKRVSRREFLKVAGIAGATVGMEAGLGGLVAACGGTTTTTTAATTAGETTTTTAAAGSSTTVSTEAEMGREVKIGYVIPQTGQAAQLGQADLWLLKKFVAATGGFIIMGDKKKHPVSVKLVDSQSDPNRASQVTGDVILNDKVDMVLGNSTAELVNAIADQAEALGTPCLTTESPLEAYFYGRGATDPKVGFKWTYHAFFSQVDDGLAVAFNMWAQVPNNKVVGVLWPNDADGQGYRKVWPEPLKEHGYTFLDAGPFNDGNEDFTSIIGEFKKSGAEIISGIMAPPDFTTFWKQCFQNTYLPKICVIAKPVLFPQGVQALGTIGEGLATTIWWHSTFPFTSSLAGQTCQQFADEYEESTGKQWVMPLGHWVLFDWVSDVLSRTTDVDDKQQIVDAILATKMTTIGGIIDFTQEIGATGGTRPVKNCVRLPCVGGQWIKGKKWPSDLVICETGLWPDIPVTAKLQPLSSFQK